MLRIGVTYCAGLARVAVSATDDPTIAVAHRVVVAALAVELSARGRSDGNRRNVLRVLFVDKLDNLVGVLAKENPAATSSGVALAAFAGSRAGDEGRSGFLGDLARAERSQ